MLDPDQRISYLQNKCNQLGDFKVALAWKDLEGNIHWTRHRSVLECWQSEEGLKFLALANNRTIFRCEVVLDLDNEPTIEKLNFICDNLEKYGFQYEAYFTGSRGYHVHLIIPELIFCSEEYRRQIRIFLIKKFDCDLMKASDNVMIAIPEVSHWKNGNKKVLLRRSK